MTRWMFHRFDFNPVVIFRKIVPGVLVRVYLEQLGTYSTT